MRLSLRSLSKRSRTDVLCAAIIVVVVTFQWCLTVGIFYGQSLFEPLSYAGDGHFTAAAIAAGMRGEFIPFVSKEFPSLGAPFVASWNDFPIVEDWLYFWVGTFARIVGVFGAINIAYWAACIAAGLSMFFVARRGFHMGAPFATMSGILYGFTMYIVSRGTHHFSLIFYWIVPLQILTSAWLASRKGIAFKTKKFWFTMAVGLITGWSFIYYAFFAMQLYALALLVRMGRPKRLQPLMVAGCPDAQLVAESIAMQLEKRISWRRALKKAIAAAIKAGVRGIKVRVSGRLDAVLPCCLGCDGTV